MDSVESYIAATLVIFGIASLMIVLRHRDSGTVSRRRMYRMMLSCGLDETTARNPDQFLDIDMQEVRARCRRCPAPDLCDRWLNGGAVPGNDFCPNADRFTAAAEARQCESRYDPSRRPGRRLD